MSKLFHTSLLQANFSEYHFFVRQETDANPNPSFLDTLLSPIYKILSFLGISMKGASAEANNNDKGFISSFDEETPAKVVEIESPRKRIFLGADGGVSSTTPLSVIPLTHPGAKSPEKPIEVIIQNKRKYLNLTTTYETSTHESDPTIARVTEIPGKPPFNLKAFLEGFTSPHPWYPELFTPPPRGHILVPGAEYKPPPSVSGGMSEQGYYIPEQVVERPFPVLGTYTKESSPNDRSKDSTVVYNRYDQSRHNMEEQHTEASSNNVLAILPPFPTMQSLVDPQQSDFRIPSLQVIPLRETAPKPPRDSARRDSFPLYTIGDVGSKMVIEYRPAFPFFRPSPIASPIVSPIVPPIVPPRKIIPIRYISIIQCRPRFPIYQGSPLVDSGNSLVPSRPNIYIPSSPNTFIPAKSNTFTPFNTSKFVPGGSYAPSASNTYVPHSNTFTPIKYNGFTPYNPNIFLPHGRLITVEPPSNGRYITAEPSSGGVQSTKNSPGSTPSQGSVVTSIKAQSPSIIMPASSVDSTRIIVPVPRPVGLQSGDVADNKKEVWN